MKFTPYLMVYKETLPLPDEKKDHLAYWKMIEQVLLRLYLDSIREQLRTPVLLRNITAHTRQECYCREPHGVITLGYNMSKVPYHIRLKWRLQELWAKIWE